MTSRLSPHLRWGEVSPYQAWHAVAASGADGESVARFLAELGWREFAAHVLFHFPDLATRNWRRQFDAFPWRPVDEEKLRAWQQGRTGIPVVDAGMHELWITGTMHNRVRMITASFLTKNLLMDWRLGEQWFWDTLVDADGASNPFNWQWVAGSGADAAPYFRIFNPELQGKKFDPDGAYVARWAPEHLTGDGPEPIVDLAESRRAALDAYEVVRREGRESGCRLQRPGGHGRGPRGIAGRPHAVGFGDDSPTRSRPLRPRPRAGAHRADERPGGRGIPRRRAARR